MRLQIGRSLALLADEMQDKLDRAMFERLQSLDDMTELAKIPAKTEAPDLLRASLERFQAAYADYSWVGFANRTERSKAQPAMSLEGKTSRIEEWFKEGSQEPFVGEVKFTPDIGTATGRANERWRISSISLFRYRTTRETFGVLGATLSADWAEEVKDTLLGSMKKSIPADVIVLNEARQVLFGPDDIAGKTLDLPSIRAARAGHRRFRHRTLAGWAALCHGIFQERRLSIVSGFALDRARP